jgi:hypothetical protein
MVKRLSVMLALMLMCAPSIPAQSADKSADSAWQKLDFLLGKWTGSAGEKDSPHGAGQGGFSFLPELDRKVIIRRNQAAYDSGVRHEDLMIIYVDPPNSPPRAIYFDTEGNVIRYTLTFPAANSVVFESDGTQPGLRHRLSYWMEGKALDGKFEVSPPGGQYKTYLSWTSKKD